MQYNKHGTDQVNRRDPEEAVSSKGLTNRDVSMYALHESAGERVFVPTEDIAVKAFELYPERFGLVKYPKYPDVDSVRVTLTDLRKAKYGTLVEGDKKKGWRMTESGKKWTAENVSRIEDAIQRKHLLERRIASGRMITTDKIVASYTNRVRGSLAFQKWTRKEPLRVYDFYDVLRVDQYTPEDVYRKHLHDMIIALSREPLLVRFLEEMDKLYGQTYRKGGGDD